MAPSIARRWLMDLSPGTDKTPPILEAGSISTRSTPTITRRLARSLTLPKPRVNQEAMTLQGWRSFELTIASRLEEMESVHALIAEAVKEYKLNNDLAHWIELTISESMINAIQHGNKADPA